jgi:CBS domain-containing protein
MPRFLARGKGRVRHEASRPAVVETPNTAGDIMTKDEVSVLVGSSVRDVAILLLEKRISAVPVLAANLQLLGMVSEGDLLGRSDTDRVARRDWWLTLLKDFQLQTETVAALAARPVEQVMRAPVLTIEAQAPLHEIAEMLKVHDIKRLPDDAVAVKQLAALERERQIEAMLLEHLDKQARTLSLVGRTRKRVSHGPRAHFRMTSDSRCR